MLRPIQELRLCQQCAEHLNAARATAEPGSIVARDCREHQVVGIWSSEVLLTRDAPTAREARLFLELTIQAHVIQQTVMAAATARMRDGALEH